MKGILFKATLFSIAIVCFSCSKTKKAATSMDFGEAHPNQIVEKTLVLNFNDEAKADSNSFVEFTYLNKDDSQPNGFEFTINGKSVQGNKLKFYAYNFVNKSPEVKIGIKFPKGTKETEYSGNFVLTNASVDLQQFITQGTDKVPSQIGEKVGKWDVIYNDPIPLWIRLVVGIGLLLFIISLLWFILSRPNMPFGDKTFKKGMLSFLDGDATTINLEKLKVYDISKKLGIEEGLTLEPFDKLYQRKKQRFARLKNNSANLEIKLKYDNVEETIGVNQELYNMDEIKIITQDKKIYLLSYSNNKISRV